MMNNKKLHELFKTLHKQNRPDNPPTESAVIEWGAGLFIRSNIRNEIEKFLDTKNIKYSLKEYPGLLWSDYRLVIYTVNWNNISALETICKWMNKLDTTWD